MADAGWFPDPTGGHQHRYFDGVRWTDHVADSGVQSSDQPGPSSPLVPVPASAMPVPGAPAAPVAAPSAGPSWGQSGATQAGWEPMQSPFPPSGFAGLPPAVNMGRIARSFRLLRLALAVAKEQPGMLVIPIVGGAIQLAIAGALAYMGNQDKLFHQSSAHHVDPLMYVVAGIGLIIVGYTAVMVKSMIVMRAMAALRGSTRSNSQALSDCLANSHRLFGWAITDLTVGLLLKLVREEFGIIGKIVASIVNYAWNLMTFFVIPVILFENMGPFRAIKRSSSIFRQTWGEEIVGTGVVGLAFFLGFLVVLVVGGIAGVVFVPAGIVVGVIGLVALIAVSSVVTGIFNTALYQYATTGSAGLGFVESDFNSAFRPKKRRRSFGV